MNDDLKFYARQRNVRLWQIATRLGINDGNFSRKLRFELPEDEKTRIREIVDELAEKKQADTGYRTGSR